MVTIIITVVKDRGWLDEAIQSALNQDYNNYEIILASGNNPDIKKYADKYNLKFSLSKGDGFAEIANKAIKIANGEYLKFLSDDDLLTLNCLTDLVKNIGGNPLVYANAINFTKQGESVYKSPAVDLKRLIKYKSSNIHDATFLFRKDILLKTKFDEKAKCCEFFDIMINYLSQGYKFSYVNKIVCRYRKHTGQTSHIPNSPERMQVKNYIINKYK